MTKKEQARMEQLLTDAALRRTSPVEPDVMPPLPGETGNRLTVGWHFNSYSRAVGMGCSSYGYHSRHSTTKTDTQQPKALYSSKMLALRAMRYELETRLCHELRSVDIMIEKEEAECAK